MKKVITIEPKLLLVAFLMLLLPFSLFAEVNLNISFSSYVDEALGLISMIYIFVLLLRNKLDISDILVFVFTTVVAVIGLVGNYTNRLITSWFPIAVDTLCLYKIFCPFIVIKHIASEDKKGTLVKYLAAVAKLFLIVTTICAIISLFVDIGMYEGEELVRRYGIYPYAFLFNNSGRYGYIVASALICIFFTESDIYKLRFYEIISLFNMIVTTKGVVYIMMFTYIVLVIMWRKSNKLSIKNIILLILGGIGVSTVQINTYILDEKSPRMIFIKYGNITAKQYFPFGSGFATFGSDMAAKNYSVLYYRYGFNERYGLSEMYPFAINDCYLGMLLGQFGYIGVFFYLLILICIFIPIQKLVIERHIKALMLAMFIGVIISTIGTAIIKSSIGVFIFAIIGMVCGYSGLETEREKYLRTAEHPDAGKLRIKFKF